MKVHDKNIINYALFASEYYTMVDILNTISAVRPQYHLSFTSDSAEKAASLLRRNDVDLVITDVELSDTLATEAIEKSQYKKPVIFFTEYKAHSAVIKPYNTVTLILKPVTETDILHSIEKFEQINI